MILRIGTDDRDDPVFLIHKSSHITKLANSRAQPEIFQSSLVSAFSVCIHRPVLIDTDDYNMSSLGQVARYWKFLASGSDSCISLNPLGPSSQLSMIA